MSVNYTVLGERLTCKILNNVQNKTDRCAKLKKILLFFFAVSSFKQILSHKVGFCSAMCLPHTKLVLHTQGCAYPIRLASRPWNAEVHIFPIQQGKTAFQSQSARNVALFLFSTELPGTYYGAVRDVYLAMATQGLLAPLRHWSCHL